MRPVLRKPAAASNSEAAQQQEDFVEIDPIKHFGDSYFGIFCAKLEDLTILSHQNCQNFPKIEKFVLSAEIRSCLSQITKLSLAASKKYYKKNTLQELDIEIEFLRLLIRKSFRLSYISAKQYLLWVSSINNLGRLVGGWIKNQK